MKLSKVLIFGLAMAFTFTIQSWAQGVKINSDVSKPALQIADLDTWPYLNRPALNANGSYAGYIINERERSKMTLHLKAIERSWELAVDSVENYAFLSDSKRVIVLKDGGELQLLKLGTNQAVILSNVRDFKLFKNSNKEWLLYLNNKKELGLMETKSSKVLSFKNVDGYLQDAAKNTILLQTRRDSILTLSSFDLSTLNQSALGEFSNADNLVIDELGKQIAFITPMPGNIGKQIILYSLETGKHTELADSNSPGIDSGLAIGGIRGFSHDGERLFLNLNELPAPKLPDDAVMVDIWSTKDDALQSTQLNNTGMKSYIAFLSVNGGGIIRLQYEKEEARFLNDKTDKWLFISFIAGEHSERNWNPAGKFRHYAVNTQNGIRKPLQLSPIAISSDNRFIVGNDSLYRDLICYDLFNDNLINITGSLPIPFKSLHSYDINEKRSMLFAGWNGNKIILYDDFDIWKIDPLKSSDPVNLTNSYGRKHNLTFKLANAGSGGELTDKDISLINGFHNYTKENGYFKLAESQHSDPVKLFMGNYYFNMPAGNAGHNFYPVKAKDASLWIVSREASNSAPNFYLTKDFKSFTPLTELYPENIYNWLTSEQVNFKSTSGEPLQGVLYKPENFNASKRYPLIIHYYERMSDHLNVFYYPERVTNFIDIPFFVSNGYCIFTPDINYKIGHPGESVLESVNGATDELKKRPYIDSAKIGLQGHSFGGYETNYLVTHSQRFAAAVSGSGNSNLISFIGSLRLKAGNNFAREWAESGQGRIGATLWERPDLYIANSPIMKADQMNTPLLMMNNHLDGIVNFSQGLEFYNALRRLKKRAWMLQYDGEGHGLGRNQFASTDYTLRMMQFFDHFLKGKPAPRWMINGIPANSKGYDKGY